MVSILSLGNNITIDEGYASEKENVFKPIVAHLGEVGE